MTSFLFAGSIIGFDVSLPPPPPLSFPLCAAKNLQHLRDTHKIAQSIQTHPSPLSLYILYTADKTTNVVRALTITQPSQHARLISTLDILTDTPHQNFVIKLLYSSFWKECIVAPPKVWFLTNLIFEAACGRPLASYKWWELMGG